MAHIATRAALPNSLGSMTSVEEHPGVGEYAPAPQPCVAIIGGGCGGMAAAWDKRFS